MIPNIVIFGKEFTPYILMALCGIFVIGILASYKSRKHDIDDNETICVLLIAAIGVFIGAHLLYAITNIPLAIKIIQNWDQINTLQLKSQAFITIFGGGVFYGGLFGGLLAAYLYLRYSKLDSTTFLWLLTPYIPLFHFFGRIGCFLSGCCYGIESPVGFIYKHSLIEEANNVCRFPIQLIEALCNLSLFILLSFLQKKDRFKNQLLKIYLTSYAIIRFILEFFRGDTIRGLWFGFSTSQIISLLVIIILSYIYFTKNNSSTCQP